MVSSILVLVVLAFAGASLAAWAKSMVPSLGRHAVVGRWVAIALPAASITAFAWGYLQAGDLGSVDVAALPEGVKRDLAPEAAAGLQLMVMSLLGGALGMAALSAYLMIMARLRADED